MESLPLTPDDHQLVAAAQDIITRLYRYGEHHVGAALRTTRGDIITAVHVEAYIGRVTVCAEAIAIGKAISEEQRDFDTIVAVRHPDPDSEDREVRVVSPCGMCRELISDYGPQAKVLFVEDGVLKKVPILTLLPGKYTRAGTERGEL